MTENKTQEALDDYAEKLKEAQEASEAMIDWDKKMQRAFKGIVPRATRLRYLQKAFDNE